MTAVRATYRLQLGPDLDFAGARALVPYLRDLGVSHLYLSPVWRARPGSTHGYDVIDPAAVSDELGGEAGLRALASEAQGAGLGLILDVVPNHMATDDANPYWADPARRAVFFDIDPVSGRHRRFFDVDELAGVRQEDPDVFAATHAKVLELVRDGVADGLRIDHPDGLSDPAAYLDALRARGVEQVWVEKILEDGEQLRDWPVTGTTGYEFAVDVQALFVDPAGEPVLTALWIELAGDERPFTDWADEAKHEQAMTTFAPEVERLRSVADVPGAAEASAALGVYRTYVAPARGEVTEEDRSRAAALPSAVRRALLLEDGDAPAEWVVRFQQLSAPVMAKGVEDTAFYRYGRLLCHNEVGGDPGRFSMSVGDFHLANAARAARFPASMLASTTHDTKRSGDVRARIGALAGVAAEWADAVRGWRSSNAVLRSAAGPTGAQELFVYQTLLGAWPIDEARLREYLVKALREAKQSTNWVTPDEAAEEAVIGFGVALLDHAPFRASFDPWVQRMAVAGARSASGQTLLRLTSPGVPDIYQGDELELLALVDPDNRRPVDWARHRAALAAADEHAPLAKLTLIRRTLALRARRPECFDGASYAPIEAGNDVCAFLRGEDVLVAVALRPDAPGEWALPASVAGDWRDVLSGTAVTLPAASLATLLDGEGVALLERPA